MVPVLFQNGRQMPTIFAEKVIFFLLFLWCSLSDFDTSTESQTDARRSSWLIS